MSLLALVFQGLAFNALAAGSSLTLVRSLDFGSFTVLGSCVNCSITVNAQTGARSASGGVILRSTNSGQSAQYTVSTSGCGSKCSYTSSVSPASVNMGTAGGTMTVQNFTTYQTPVVGNNGTSTLSIGATLLIPSVNVTPGTYTSGSFTVTTTP